MAFKIKDGISIGTVGVFNSSGQLLVPAPSLTTARSISLSGDLTGSASFDGSADISIAATIAANSVALGTDTTGNYVATIAAGTIGTQTSSSGLTIVAAAGEGTAATIAHADTSTLSGAQGSSGISSITVDGMGHVTAVSTATYLTAESDTFATVTGRGATTATAISITNSTASTSTSTGALIVTGGLGIGGSAYIGGSITVTGDLVVNGTTTTVNSTTITVDDKNLELNSIASPTDVLADGGGITLRGTTDKTINWSDATDSWVSSENIQLAAGKTIRLYGSTSGTAIITTAAAAGTPTLTLPTTTGTIALTSDIGNGTLSLTAAAGATNTSVSVSTGTGYSANTSTNTTYTITVGPALANLATLMTGATTGFIKKTAADTYTLDTSTYLTSGTGVSGITATSPIVASASTGSVTISHANSGVTAGTYNSVTVNATGHVTSATNVGYLTAEADTLSTVTGRGASTGSAITITNTTDATSKTTGSLIIDGGISVDKQIYHSGIYAQAITDGTKIVDQYVAKTTVAVTTATVVDSWAIATYRSVKYLVQITQGTAYQISEILVIHNGTTTLMTEYGVIESGSALGTFSTDVNTGNARLIVTMGSATSSTILVSATRMVI